jgi:hypothetical protein
MTVYRSLLPNLNDLAKLATAAHTVGIQPLVVSEQTLLNEVR